MPKQYHPPYQGPYYQLTLRLPQRLYEYYRKAADKRGVSLNSHLIDTLEKHHETR